MSRAPLLVLLCACTPVVPSGGTVAVVDETPASADGGADGADGDEPDPDDTGDPMVPVAACGLQHDLEDVWFTEGDTITFTVGCAETGEGARPELAVVGASDTATLDQDSGGFVWPTDGRDGGRHDLILTASRGTDAAPETQVVTLWIADRVDAPNASAPEPLRYTEEWGLPVVHIQVDDTLTETEQDAVLTVRDTQVTGAAKIRGASSAGYPKTSFTLDFESDELGVTEWGERTREHMVLITPFDDNSYVRQKLAYDLWAAMGTHMGDHRLTPRTFFTVVYINGVYQGLYIGCDRIDDEFIRHMGLDGEGQMYKAVSHDANFKLVDSSGRPKSSLGAGYEKTEGDDGDWSDLNALVTFTGTADGDTLLAEGGDWIDLNEFVDWYLFVRLILAEDSAGKNAYLFREPDTTAFRFVPWDMNHAFGQNWYTARTSARTNNEYEWNNGVFMVLNDHEEGLALLRSRYTTLREPGGPFDPSWMHAQIDEYEAILGPAIARDWDRWGSSYRSYDRWRSARNSADDWTDPTGELAYLHAWIDARVDVQDGIGW